jgi:hypothetical protein
VDEGPNSGPRMGQVIVSEVDIPAGRYEPVLS